MGSWAQDERAERLLREAADRVSELTHEVEVIGADITARQAAFAELKKKLDDAKAVLDQQRYINDRR